MIEGVEVIQSESRYDFEKMLNEKISRKEVKDIKFCANPKIRQGYSSSYSNGTEYYAMIIYGE